mgnify:CR=1 FL=1
MKRRPSQSQAADRAAWSIEEFATRYGISRSRVYQEIAAGRPRSGVVLLCIDDYLAGRGLPLEAVAPLRDERPGP